MAVMMYSCASMGRPTGGPIDLLPPVFVKADPMPGATNVNKSRFIIEFDELIEVKDQQTKVAVSPAQTQAPVIRSDGKRITVELRDTLLPNTTYTLDFSDAICDYNENNPYENFCYSFSTGNTVDSLRIAGIVLDAHNLEPLKGMLVGIQSNLADSAFTTLPLERIARTNDRGEFIIHGIASGSYNLFAINDVDRDNKHANPGEDIAFCSELIVPKVEPTSVVDTIRNIKHEVDSIITTTKNVYMPNNILLSMFNEGRQAQYLKTHERLDSTRLYFQFGAKAEKLPEIRLLSPTPSQRDWYLINHSETNDTITYWLTDPSLIAKDSLMVEAKYMRSNKEQVLEEFTDTILFKAKREKIKKKKKGEEADSIPKQIFTDFKMLSSTQQDVNLPLNLSAATPLFSIDPTKFHLQIKQDTLWIDEEQPTMERVIDRNLSLYRINRDWKPGGGYKLIVDSAAVTDIYGNVNKGFEHQFNVKQLEDYANLTFSVNVTDSAFIELLSQDKPVRTAPVINGIAQFDYVNPGDYFARIILDRNGNGKWDTGNYEQRVQPEDVCYYNKKLKLKKNWDINETWDIYAVPVDKQKPEEIKANKPTKKKWEQELEKEKNEKEKKKKKNSFGEEEDDDSPFSQTYNPIDQRLPVRR